MIKSLFSGVAGLKTHQQKMDIIGNNIANVNTTAFKASRVTFKDIYYQTKSYGTAGEATAGGLNYKQVGYGSTTASIDMVMSQSGFTQTDSSFDLAIAGEGFFQVMDEFGNIFYTRSGIFKIDDYNNLVDNAGNLVLGVNGAPFGEAAGSTPLKINVPTTQDTNASFSKVIDGSTFRITASIPGDVGNLTLNFQDGNYPYATLSNSALTITMDRTIQYETMADLENAIMDAIRAGGVILPNGIELDFTIDPEPTTLEATPKIAENTQSWKYTFKDPVGDTKTYGFYAEYTAGGGGEDANAYTIQYSYSTSKETYASWDGNSLTITLGCDALTGLDSLGQPAAETDIMVIIQNAINKVAGINDMKKIQIGAFELRDYDDPTDPTQFTTADLATVYADLSTMQDADGNDVGDTAGILATIAKSGKVKLMGGSDAYYTKVLKSLNTCGLTGGLIGEDQSFKQLESFSIQSDGTMLGIHPVHGTIYFGRIDIVTFENPAGLEQIGNSYFKETQSSGASAVTIPGENASGELVSGALEMSNVDLSQEMSDMILTQRGFQANSRIITTSDEILQELIGLKR